MIDLSKIDTIYIWSGPTDMRKEISGLISYVQATNLGDDASEIYKTSRMRWQIEYCFRTMKSQIDARPIYLTTSSHIVGHFTIVFLALQTLRYMMYKLYIAEGNKNIVLHYMLIILNFK